MIARCLFPGFPVALSKICFGTAQFGASIDRDTAFSLLDRYYEMGGNFLDTAHLYGGGGTNQGEWIIGDWLRSRGVHDVIVATKGCHFDTAQPSVSRVTRECVRADLAQSRERLGMDTIPLYWLHRDDPSKPIEEIVEFCEELRREGWIQTYGFSNYCADRVRAALAYADHMGYQRIFGVSNEWSLAEEHGAPFTDPSGMVLMDEALYALHIAEKLPAVPFTAAAHGYFARLENGAEIPPSLRRFDTEENRRLLPVLQNIAGENAVDVSDAAVAYLLQSEIPTIPVVSTSRLCHLEAFEKIASVQFDISALRKFGKTDEF